MKARGWRAAFAVPTIAATSILAIASVGSAICGCGSGTDGTTETTPPTGATPGSDSSTSTGRSPSTPPSPSVRGSILSPTDGERVSGPTPSVSGTLSNIPAGYHFWIVVRTGKNMWPKTPQLRAREGAWEITIQQSTGKVSFVLLMMDAEGNDAVRQWFAEGKATQNWPGIPEIPGSTELDAVSNVRVQ